MTGETVTPGIRGGEQRGGGDPSACHLGVMVFSFLCNNLVMCIGSALISLNIVNLRRPTVIGT
jgi:hypothetical protein